MNEEIMKKDGSLKRDKQPGIYLKDAVDINDKLAFISLRVTW